MHRISYTALHTQALQCCFVFTEHEFVAKQRTTRLPLGMWEIHQADGFRHRPTICDLRQPTDHRQFQGGSSYAKQQLRLAKASKPISTQLMGWPSSWLCKWRTYDYYDDRFFLFSFYFRKHSLVFPPQSSDLCFVKVTEEWFFNAQ